MDNVTLSKLTGLPNLDTVDCPTRLERLAVLAHSQQNSYTLRAPLRLKAATAEYAKRAEAMLTAVCVE